MYPPFSDAFQLWRRGCAAHEFPSFLAPSGSFAHSCRQKKGLKPTATQHYLSSVQNPLCLVGIQMWFKYDFNGIPLKSSILNFRWLAKNGIPINGFWSFPIYWITEPLRNHQPTGVSERSLGSNAWQKISCSWWLRLMIPHTFPFFEARHFNVSNLHCTRLQTAWPPTVTLLSTLSFSRDFGLANLQFLMTAVAVIPRCYWDQQMLLLAC